MCRGPRQRMHDPMIGRCVAHRVEESAPPIRTHAIAFRQMPLFVYCIRQTSRAFIFSSLFPRIACSRPSYAQCNCKVDYGVNNSRKQSPSTIRISNLLRCNLEHLTFVCVTCEQSIHLRRCELRVSLATATEQIPRENKRSGIFKSVGVPVLVCSGRCGGT